MNKRLRERQLRAAIEYRRMGLSHRMISEKTGLSKSAVGRFLRNFDPENEYEVEEMREKDRPERKNSREQQLMEENDRLRAELKKVRKEADFQNLRADVLDEMINIAEREFGIPVRKKSGVKR